VVGHAAGGRGRKLRQAMSLMVDTEGYTERFTNKRGIPAQSPLPPGLFGFDESYRNPYRQVDLTLATSLMEEAGYPGGIDPATGRALKLTFDTPDPSAQGRARYQFFVDAWRRLGVDVEIASTNYNQFQDKVQNGAYQLFMWGWVADYPDPENFLFLLHGPNGRTASGGPNTANFKHARYDELFIRMKDMANSPERALLIGEMLKIIEDERPWMELFHRENYSLYHSWLANVKPVGLSFATAKYRGLDAVARAQWRKEHNHPIRWPLYLFVIGFVAMLVRGVQTFMEERQ
ncbi:MAG: peptide ABC transporter substrate-binding protein, partial [Deltaproteobacteria bacterium]|nr:peptide ABC transporter substrate-binding protein [Deltaproteobacteria bacterium]